MFADTPLKGYSLSLWKSFYLRETFESTEVTKGAFCITVWLKVSGISPSSLAVLWYSVYRKFLATRDC